MLDALAEVNLHAIQTSGQHNPQRDRRPFLQVRQPPMRSRIPAPIAELLRQWSTDHPEFQSMPRKFKIAVSAGAENDRAVHQGP